MSLPLVPLGTDPQLARLLQEMRYDLTTLKPNRIPPSEPTNLTVVPLAAGNQVTFTRSDDALGYVLRFGAGSTWNPSTDYQVDLGDSNVYNDHTGSAGVTRYYWVLAKKADLYSKPVGPVAGTSLAIGTPVVIPTPPPSGIIRRSDETGGGDALAPRGSGRLR